MVVVVGPVPIPLDVWNLVSGRRFDFHLGYDCPCGRYVFQVNPRIDDTDIASITNAIQQSLDGMWELAKDYGLEYDCARHFVRSLISTGSQPRLLTVGDVYSAQQGAIYSWDL